MYWNRNTKHGAALFILLFYFNNFSIGCKMKNTNESASHSIRWYWLRNHNIFCNESKIFQSGLIKAWMFNMSHMVPSVCYLKLLLSWRFRSSGGIINPPSSKLSNNESVAAGSRAVKKNETFFFLPGESHFCPWSTTCGWHYFLFRKEKEQNSERKRHSTPQKKATT